MALLGQVLSAERLGKMLRQTRQATYRLQATSMRLYGAGHYFVTGPLRNIMLVGREFVGTVARERQLAMPRMEEWHLAKNEYRNFYDRLMPQAMRREGRWLNALQEGLGHFTWTQVGSGALLVGEVLSLYYISKLATKTGKLSLNLIFG